MQLKKKNEKRTKLCNDTFWPNLNPSPSSKPDPNLNPLSGCVEFLICYNGNQTTTAAASEAAANHLNPLWHLCFGFLLAMYLSLLQGFASLRFA